MSKTKVVLEKELSLKEIQGVALNLLEKFNDICREQSFSYSLGGGTLLGAVRHKGFIPWDDDIDIMMPRPDYDKFLEYCQEYETLFDCLSLEYTKGYNDLFAKLSDKQTICLDTNKSQSYEIGVSIDIFPIDGLGDSFGEALKQFKKTSFMRELLVASKWKNYTRSTSRSLIYEPIRFAFYLMSRIVDKNRLVRQLNDAFKEKTFQHSAYAACISGVYREKEIMVTKTFTDLRLIAFEEREFSAIRDYEGYLTKHYGDYMSLPPKEKQISHHTAQFYWKEVEK